MKRALLIGINNYPTAPLKGCVNDAKELGAILERNGDGSPNFEVRVHTDVPSRAVLTELIYNLFRGNSDVSLLYFSGHGAVDILDTYLVTPDARRFDMGVSVNTILSMANSSESANRIIVLDCCHAGAFGAINLIGRQTAVINTGVTIMAASRADELALEINGHGLFTSLFIEALKGGSADIRGHISPGSVYAYIDQALGAHDQRPLFKTNVTEFTSLRKVIAQVPADVIRKIKFYFPTPQSEFNLDPSYEETNKADLQNSMEPYSNPENVKVFKELQRLQSIGLIIPKNAEYMYFAAMNSQSCVLTPLGHHYWKLTNENRF